MDSEKETSLEASDISTTRLGRRSALRSIGGTVLGAAAMAGAGIAFTSSIAQAQGCSDSDGGHNADPGGHGRYCQRHSDPGGRGGNCTDSDGGHNADPGGRGSHCSDHD